LEKRAEQVLPGGWRGEGGGRKQGGEMNQCMYIGIYKQREKKGKSKKKR
jgi:hypothetical protein